MDILGSEFQQVHFINYNESTFENNDKLNISSHTSFARIEQYYSQLISN